MKALSLVRSSSVAKTCLGVIAFVFLTGLAGHIRIYLPETPVPITLQSMVVLLSGACLGFVGGMSSQVLVILLSFVGWPMFSQAVTWESLWMLPSGGYIVGFIASAGAAGLARRHIQTSSWLITFATFFLLSMLILVPGLVWLKVVTENSWSWAWQAGFVPFLLGDILKCAFATALLKNFRVN